MVDELQPTRDALMCENAIADVLVKGLALIVDRMLLDAWIDAPELRVDCVVTYGSGSIREKFQSIGKGLGVRLRGISLCHGRLPRPHM
jgi:hypothetical protein